MRVLLLLALLLGLAAPAGAQTHLTGRRVALVIGNGAYRSVDRLPNADNDATLIAATLKSLDFTLVGGGPLLDLDRGQFAQAIQDFGRALAGAEVGLFYYSGHGLQVAGTNWLVPIDANPTRPQDLDFQMIDADLVLRQMDGAGTKLNLVLLDACRNNPFATRGVRALQSGLAEMRAPEGTLLSYATQPGNVALDGAGKNGPYAEALAAGMRAPGVDVLRMFNQVGLQVKRSTGGSQQPWVSSSPIDGDFFFQAAPQPAPQLALVVPPVPAVPVAPGPTEAERLLGAIRGLRCSIANARLAGDRVEIRGTVLAGPDWTALFAAPGASRGIRLVTPEVERVPAFGCAALDSIASTVRAGREAGGPPLLVLPRREVAAGGSLAVRVGGAVGGGVVLDLYRPDGTVEHLSTRLTLAGADLVEAVAFRAGESQGPRLLTVLVAPAALAVGGRADVEPAGPYLALLRSVLPGVAGLRGDVATFDVRGAARPVAIPAVGAPAPARSGSGSRCSAILEHAQLGEEVTDADRGYLRTECR